MIETNLVRHACKILCILISKDRRLEEEYTRMMEGVPTAESPIVNFGRSADSDRYKQRRRRLHKSVKVAGGRVVSTYDHSFDSHGFVNVHASATRNSGFSKPPELNYINAEKVLKNRKRLAENALKDNLNMNQLFWVCARFKNPYDSVTEIARRFEVDRDVIDKPVKKAVSVVIPTLSKIN